MTEPERDTKRRLMAVRAILSERDPVEDLGDVMVTLEGVVGAILLLVMRGDHRKAAGMLNEGLVEGVEARLAHAAEKKRKGKT